MLRIITFAGALAWSAAPAHTVSTRTAASGSGVAQADLVVLMRVLEPDRQLWSLWLSSRSLAHEGEITGSLESGIWIAVGGGRDSYGWPVIGFAPQLDVTRRRSTSGSPAERTQLDGWLEHRPRSQGTIAGLIDLDGGAAWWGEACSECGGRASDDLVVLGRGLPPQTLDLVADRLASTRMEGVQKLLRLAESPQTLWPSRTPIRSAYVLGVAREHAREELIVDYDRRGRAGGALVGLHIQHLGEIELPYQLARAGEALGAGNKPAGQRALRRAIQTGRTAVAADPKDALWHARLALALAMQPGVTDDDALRALDQALSLAPQAVEVRKLAAEVLWLRGDGEGAKLHLATALRLAPSDTAVLRVLQNLAPKAKP